MQMHTLVIRDKGWDSIHGGLVVLMYFVAVTPIAVQYMLEAEYIYLPKWMLLTSLAFMANSFLEVCTVVSRYHYSYLSELVNVGYCLDLAMLDPLWSQMDVCHHSRTALHHRSKFVPFASSSYSNED